MTRPGRWLGGPGGSRPWAVFVTAVAMRCTSTPPPGTPATDPPSLYATPSCPQPGQSPRVQPDGELTCVPVGAVSPSTPVTWPDATDAPAPVVYVRPGATGTGTLDQPYGDLATALAATPPAGTVLLSAGTFTLPGTLAPGGTLLIRGVGPDSTILTAPSGVTAVLVHADAAPGITVTLSRLGIRYPAGPTAMRVGAVHALGATARCILDTVSVDGGGDGIQADQGATVCATGLSVRGVGQRGVALLGNSSGYLRDVLVRGAGTVGVLADRAHLDLETSLVIASGRDGVAVLGIRQGEPCTTDADCITAAPCQGFSLARTCTTGLSTQPADGGVGVMAVRTCRTVNVLTDVASLQNHVTGVRVERAQPTPAEIAGGLRDAVLAWPGPAAQGNRLVIAGTAVLPGAPGGDGLYVGPGGLVTLDATVSTDDQRGRASQILANARTGVLVDGDRAVGAPGTVVPDALRQAGTLDLAGTRVASNAGPGVFIQERSLAARIAYADVTDNAALGLGVTSGGGLALMICNRFIFTRWGTITPEDPAVAPFQVGDGVSMAEGTGALAHTRIVDTEFSNNRRFGLVLDSFDATLDDGTHGGNHGTGNTYGLGIYGTTTLNGSTPRSAIHGTMPSLPDTAPTVRDSLVTTPGA